MDLTSVEGYKILFLKKQNLALYAYITRSEIKDVVGRSVLRADILVLNINDLLCHFPHYLFSYLKDLRSKIAIKIGDEEKEEIEKSLNKLHEKLNDEDIKPVLGKWKEKAGGLFEAIFNAMTRKEKIMITGCSSNMDEILQIIFPLLPPEMLSLYTYTNIASNIGTIYGPSENFLFTDYKPAKSNKIKKLLKQLKLFKKGPKIIDINEIKTIYNEFVFNMLYRDLYSIGIVERINVIQKFYRLGSANRLIDVWEKYKRLMETLENIKKIEREIQKIRESSWSLHSSPNLQ